MLCIGVGFRLGLANLARNELAKPVPSPSSRETRGSFAITAPLFSSFDRQLSITPRLATSLLKPQEASCIRSVSSCPEPGLVLHDGVMANPFGVGLCAVLLWLSSGARSAALEQWLYCAQNLWVDKNIVALEVLFERAARAGYTHVLLTDSKFGKLGEMDARYFRNVERVKRLAAAARLEIVPAVFPVGYSNDILWHDPNLIEAMPVREARFVVKGGEARLQPESKAESREPRAGGRGDGPAPDPRPSSLDASLLEGGDFADLKLWGWHDPTVVAENGAALIRNPNGQNARLSQKVKLTPFRQYHISVRVKTEEFRGTPEVKLLVGNRGLNYDALGAKPTQDWTTHHVVFNSLSNTEAQIYFGCWGGRSGSLWFDDAKLEEVGLVNLVRREGAPLVVRREEGGALIEGQDFERVVDPKMGVKLWKGSYDVYHEPPVIRTALADGTRLRVSYYHGVTVNEDQAMICPSEPRTVELLRDQAKRMHSAWGAKGYMMSHDEIRVLNWCDACQKRNLDAGALLADNARTCVKILREVNLGGRIYVWSDMFDPNHNAHKEYYLVRGDLSGSWEGLDKDVIMVPWYFEKRAASLKFFAERGHRQLIAGYYDHKPEQVVDWLRAAQAVPGVDGVMYTTWRHEFKDLEAFAESVRGFRP